MLIKENAHLGYVRKGYGANEANHGRVLAYKRAILQSHGRHSVIKKKKKKNIKTQIKATYVLWEKVMKTLLSEKNSTTGSHSTRLWSEGNLYCLCTKKKIPQKNKTTTTPLTFEPFHSFFFFFSISMSCIINH